MSIMQAQQVNRARVAARAAANGRTGQHGHVTPPVRQTSGGYIGQTKRDHKRPGRDKGQGYWRTVSAFSPVGRFER